MKKLVYIFLVFLALSAAVGCSRSVDKRLVIADTLMWKAPDSSLAILNSINRDSLQGDENQAYYALLLTQARFRVDYYDYPSDSLINIALEYYSENHNREHYTRSLLYKGAFYEVHENPVEAIKWYKQAEDNADSADYRNLAQINFRMGKIYYINYASNNLDLEKFKKALKYYKILGDRRMIMISLSHIGNLYRASDRLEAIKCLNEAKRLAIEINDTASYYNQLNELSMAYFLDSLYVEAKDAAMECINNIVPTNAMLFNVVNAYAMLGMPDSASFYLNKVETDSISDYDRMMVAFSKSYIFKALGNEKDALFFQNLGTALSETIEVKSSRNSIFEFETNFDNERIASKDKKVTSLRQTIYYLIALFLVFAIIASLFIIYRKKRKDQQRLIEELRDEGFSKYEELKNNLLIIDNHFSKTMNEKLNSFEEIMAGAYNPQQDSKSNVVMHKIAPIEDEDTKFWEGLYAYINIKHNGAMDKIANDFPQLSASDLNFIKLMCCGFSDAAIAVCRNYRHIDSVRGRKQKIRRKMGIEETLAEYVKNITNNK